MCHIPQEDANHGVSADIILVTLLKEDIGLVQQNDGVPGAGNFENLS
jgi:hypothetical protein